MTFTTTSSPGRTPFAQNTLLKTYVALFGLCWLLTLVFTTDHVNWIIENILTFALLTLLTWSYRKFRFSDLSYTLIFVYLLLHIYGATYTYAENPFGYWLKDTFHLKRNHYDRIVHFSFGFMLTYPMRDYFRNWFEWPKWVCWILPVEITMSFSGVYEIIEWLVADIFFSSHGDAYLGTQGDIWDAQKDMGLAVSGAILVMLAAAACKKLLRR